MKKYIIIAAVALIAIAIALRVPQVRAAIGL